MASILEAIQKQALEALNLENTGLSSSDDRPSDNVSLVGRSDVKVSHNVKFSGSSEKSEVIFTPPKSEELPGHTQELGLHIHKKEKDVKIKVKMDQEHKNRNVFVQFPGKFPGMELEGYLKNRLGRSKPFQYICLPTKPRRATTVKLEFSDMKLARSALRKLKRSNQEKNVMKLKCSFYEAELQICERVEKIVERISRCKEELNLRKTDQLQKHDAKIFEIEINIQSLQVSKHIPLEEYDRIAAERKALNDKLLELRLQRDGFCSFIDESILSKIDSLRKNESIDHKIKQLRIKFGIEIGRLDKALPIYARRQEILDVVSNHQVSIILGETGSGKSTQMTQYLLEAGLADSGMIACTQPRKIAATSLATRVSSELLSSVGQTVGYKVGMRVKTSSMTKIVYLTDHMLLNEILNDRTLSKYGCIVIDEAHERSIYTDLLLGMIKQCLEMRPDLKVLITSATIDPKLFVRYFNTCFNGCPVVCVSGRTFPVDVVWLDPSTATAFENHVQSAVATAADIHQVENEGDILVFLTSPLETEKCCTLFQERLADRNDYKCLQLHGKLQSEEQQAVFEPLSRGKRKIVFATNSAETSVTIPGIKYVVDTGLVKEMRFDAKKNMSSLDVAIISKSSAEQRKGRAGRTSPGKCFCLYTEDDFEKMATGSLPEILRVHLAQALLKLLELGVDPLTFDFVQPPSEASMKSAMASLESLGAVEERRITELGKKLSLLPFDPRLSKLVLMGLEEDIAYEAICLAALANAGSSVFFRAGTDQEKNKSDLLKTRFCHPDGDHLTLLCVYEEWFKVPEKEKSKWCMNNSINARAIRTVRETANEVVTTIKKELKHEVKVHFTPTSKIQLKIMDLLFQASKENIAFFLGHPKAGYVVPQQQQQAQIHPSSSLNVLGGAFPEWIIFEQHINTSRDFLTTVSPVCRDIVLSASNKGDLSFDITTMEKLRVSSICNRDLGRVLFWGFVGPRYGNLKKIEAELSSELQGALAYIDADANSLKIEIHTNGGEVATANRVIDQYLVPTLKRLKSADQEVPLHHKVESVRGVIGAGAQLSAILYAGQYRTVFVEGVSKDIDELTIEQLFSRYGEVVRCTSWKRRNPSHPDRWGSVTFKMASDAAAAVARTADSSNAKAIASHFSCGNAKPRDFTLRLSWTRRKPRGFGFIHFCRPEDLALFATQRSTVVIDQHHVSISMDMKTHGSIYMRNLPPSVTEEKVVRVVNDHFQGMAAVGPVVEKVAIIRQGEFQTAERDLQILQDDIQRQILNYVPGRKVELNIRTPTPKNIQYTAFLRFTNPDDGVQVYNAIHDRLTSMGERIKVLQDLSTDIFVPKYIYKVLQEELETTEQKLKRDSLDGSFSIVEKKSKAGHFYITIKSENPDTLAWLKREYDSLLAGEVVDCSNCESSRRILFDREGRERLVNIEKKNNIIIRSDFRLWKIVVIGKADNRQNAIAQIQDYIDILKSSTMQRVNLRGENKPRGLMKHLLNAYGTDLKGLKEKTRVEAIELDFRRQVVVVRGSEDSVQKTVDQIEYISDKLSVDEAAQCVDDGWVECVICLCPIDRGYLYRLNLCGHAYCLDCAKRQLQTGVSSRTLPLECASGDCDQLWCWNDVEEIVRGGTTPINQIVSASVSCFVQQNKDQYQYCLTPDCPIIFPVSKDGKLFICEACEMRICTSCKVQYHDDLTCAMYNSEKTDQGVEDWLAKDTTNRKLCPKCRTPIEKNGGCQHMTCSVCGIHICWLCMETFADGDKCYGHLSSKHGTFI